jgi:O-antigen ligase
MNLDSSLRVGRSNAQQALFFIRWSLYLFAFLVPLENVDFFGIGGIFTMTKMAGIMFAGLCLLQPTVCLARPPAAFWWFVTYLLIWSVEGMVLTDNPFPSLFHPFMTLVQNLLMFWLCYNIIRTDKAARGVLLSYVAGAATACMSILVGVGETVYVSYIGGSRVSALGANANVFGYAVTVAVLILIGLVLGRTRAKTMWTLPCLSLALVLFYYVVRTGSRGALLCVVVSTGIVFLRGGGVGTRLKMLFFGSVVVIAGVYVVLSSESAMARIKSTIETGELANREKISADSWALFLQKPIFGWGPVTHLMALSTTMLSEVDYIDTHNDLLWVLTATGLVGTIPFVGGFGSCVWSAWRGRNAIQGYLPLMLVMAAIVMGISGTHHNRKVTWIVLAYAAAAATYIVPPQPRNGPPMRPNRP